MDRLDRRLHELVDRNEIDTIVGLVKQGGDVNALDAKGRSLLVHVVQNKNIPLLRVLLDAGVDPN